MSDEIGKVVVELEMVLTGQAQVQKDFEDFAARLGLDKGQINNLMSAHKEMKRATSDTYKSMTDDGAKYVDATKKQITETTSDLDKATTLLVQKAVDINRKLLPILHEIEKKKAKILELSFASLSDPSKKIGAEIETLSKRLTALQTKAQTIINKAPQNVRGRFDQDFTGQSSYIKNLQTSPAYFREQAQNLATAKTTIPVSPAADKATGSGVDLLGLEPGVIDQFKRAKSAVSDFSAEFKKQLAYRMEGNLLTREEIALLQELRENAESTISGLSDKYENLTEEKKKAIGDLSMPAVIAEMKMNMGELGAEVSMAAANYGEFGQVLKDSKDRFEEGDDATKKNTKALMQQRREWSIYKDIIASVSPKMAQLFARMRVYKIIIGQNIGKIGQLIKVTDSQKGAISGLAGASNIGRKALTALAVGANLLKVALIATGIGAIIVALGTMSMWLSRTAAGSKVLRNVTQTLTSAWEVGANRAAKFFQSMIDGKGIVFSIKEAFVGYNAELAINKKILEDIYQLEQRLRIERSKHQEDIATTDRQIARLQNVIEDTRRPGSERVQAFDDQVFNKENLINRLIEFQNEDLRRIKLKLITANENEAKPLKEEKDGIVAEIERLNAEKDEIAARLPIERIRLQQDIKARENAEAQRSLTMQEIADQKRQLEITKELNEINETSAKKDLRSLAEKNEFVQKNLDLIREGEALERRALSREEARLKDALSVAQLAEGRDKLEEIKIEQDLKNIQTKQLELAIKTNLQIKATLDARTRTARVIAEENLSIRQQIQKQEFDSGTAGGALNPKQEKAREDLRAAEDEIQRLNRAYAEAVGDQLGILEQTLETAATHLARAREDGDKALTDQFTKDVLVVQNQIDLYLAQISKIEAAFKGVRSELSQAISGVLSKELERARLETGQGVDKELIRSLAGELGRQNKTTELRKGAEDAADKLSAFGDPRGTDQFIAQIVELNAEFDKLRRADGGVFTAEEIAQMKVADPLLRSITQQVIALVEADNDRIENQLRNDDLTGFLNNITGKGAARQAGARIKFEENQRERDTNSAQKRLDDVKAEQAAAEAILPGSGDSFNETILALDSALKEQLISNEEYYARKKAEINQKILDKTREFAATSIGIFQSITANQIAGIESEIRMQERKVDRATRIAEKGNADVLEAEENRLEALSKKREEFVEKQQQLANLQIAINQAIAISEGIKAVSAAFGSGNILVGIATSLALGAQVAAMVVSLGNAFSDLPSFYEGTEKTGSGSVDGRGGFTAVLHPGERVVPAKYNTFDIPNSELPKAISLYDTFKDHKIASALTDSIIKSPGDNAVMNEVIEMQRLHEVAIYNLTRETKKHTIAIEKMPETLSRSLSRDRSKDRLRR